MQHARRQFRRSVPPLLAAWLVLLVLALNVFAAAPALHKAIHADADRGDHECAITLFAHGQVDAATGDGAVIEAAALIESLPLPEISFFNATIGQLPAGRAPPLSACFPA